MKTKTKTMKTKVKASTAGRARTGRSVSGKSARSAKATKATKTAKTKRASGKREMIQPNSDSRYVRRAATGRFKQSDDVGKALRADRRTKARNKVKSGYGDRGDR